MAVSSAPDPQPGNGKIWGGVGGALIGGAVAAIVIRLLNVEVPGFLDAPTSDAIRVLGTAATTWFGGYIIPHGGTS